MYLPEAQICIREGSKVYSADPIITADAAIKIAQEMIGNLSQEAFLVINLNTQKEAINYTLIAMGGVKEAHVDIAAIMKTALLANASSLILLHNHPSGHLSVSNSDKLITRKVVEAAELFGIKVCDHIIVGPNTSEYVSFLREGYMDED